MLDSIIKDYKKEVLEQFEQLTNSVNKLDKSFDYKNKLSEIQEQINRPNPSIMFYGIYNAGKSSVLNAIFGEQKASVNDIPETHCVTEYKWKNYILVDTPGLNGPPEDEKITLPEVKKRDIIMFIIDDSDNFDSEEITRKIVEILESERPCIIVINKKNDSDMDKIYKIKQKMNDNIRKISNISNPDFLYEFIDVNAHTALRAKKENKEGLLEYSNIRLLEDSISKKLASVNGIQMLKVPLGNMYELCDEILVYLHECVKNTDSRKMEDLIRSLLYEKNNAIIKFESSVDEKMSLYADTMYAQLSAGKEADFDKKSCEEDISKLANDCIRAYCEETNATMRNIVDKWRLDLTVDKVEAEKDNFLKEIPKVREEKPEKDEIDKTLDILEAILIMDPIPPIPVPFPIPPVVIVGFLKLLKGIFAGKRSDEGSIDVDELNEKQREAYEKHRLALKELRGQITLQMNQFSSKVKGLFHEEIEKIYKSQKEKLEEIISGSKSKEQMWVNLIQEVEENKGKIERIKSSIITGKCV